MASISGLVSEIKRISDELKRLRGRVDSFSSGSTLIVNGGVSGVLLSDAIPTPNTPGQAGDAGISLEASRSDHAHETPEPVGAGKYLQFTYTGDNPFEFVTDMDGQPVFAELDVIA